MDTVQIENSLDTASLQRFNYKQELVRRIGFFGSFAVAFSSMSMTTGIFAAYGFVLKNCGPVAIWTWPLVAAAQIVVAVIMAELAGRIPVSGYSYQWVTRLSSPALGWLCGWLGIFLWVTGIAVVNFALAPVVAGIFGLTATKINLTIIALIVVSLQALINMRGVKLTSQLNNSAVYTEIAGLLGIAVIVATILFRKGSLAFHPSILFSFAPGIKSGALGALILGSLMACWTFETFESSADLSEETLGATKVVPKALVSSIIYAALVGLIFLVVITIAIPNLNAIANSDNPIPEILQSVLGHGLSTLFLLVVIVSMFACGTVGMAAASRIIYSMARDGVFVFSQFFRKISSNKVPQRGVEFVFLLNVCLIFFVSSFTDLIAASAALPIFIYLITVGSYAYRSKTLPPVDTFHLGRWNMPLTILALLWSITEIGILTIPQDFHGGAKICLMVILSGVAIYFLVVRKHVVSGKAGIQDKYV